MLGTLFVCFIIMGLAGIIGSVFLFEVKNPRVFNVLLIIMTVYSLVIAYLSATAQPTNFVVQKIVIVGIGLVAVIGAVMRFTTKKMSIVSKSLVAGSVIFGILGLFFM